MLFCIHVLEQSHRVSTASEPSLTLRQVDIDDRDVEFLRQIINELEAENAAMSSEVDGNIIAPFYNTLMH